MEKVERGIWSEEIYFFVPSMLLIRENFWAILTSDFNVEIFWGFEINIQELKLDIYVLTWIFGISDLLHLFFHKNRQIDFLLTAWENWIFNKTTLWLIFVKHSCGAILMLLLFIWELLYENYIIPTSFSPLYN